VRRELPSGTVTFLFTDVEGSTKLLHSLGAEVYAEALADHRRVIRETCARHEGVEVDTQGDAFFFAFPTAPEALASAAAMTEALSSGPIQVRIGLHTGTPLLTEEGYVGDDVHLGARVAATGHGRQGVLSIETAALVELALTDLGEHRLKDVEDAVSIFQLGDGQFPPLKTISNTNLPSPASSFLGREQELAEVLAKLEGGARLLTFTGPGGTGKTRLAIEAAASLVPSYKAGVFWVGLASLRDPALVTEAISQTLGAKDGLAEHIQERELLLLLDNLEQVIVAAPELSRLLSACPNLNLFVTSRELLRVQGEVEYPVPPLAAPEAIALFRARSGLEESAEIVELCARLDSLPLAVELAAARAKALSPAQILDRLSGRLDLLKGGRDADPRQQTLRATIEWSYDLLLPDEQQLFACLSVFAGGCTLDAAEEVCGAGLDTLQSLVEKNLLRYSAERYWMLETIREYATERLAESGEAQELGRRHAEHFLALAEEAYPHLRGSPKEWLDRLDVEHDNFRAALDWLEASGRTQLALQLAGAMSRFWYMRGHLAEGWRALESLLRADERDERPTAARARALNGVAVMAANGEDLATGRLRAEEALELHRKLGDAWGAAYSIFMLGIIATEESDWAKALPLFEESLRAFRELGDEHYILLATDGLAWMYRALGDRERSRSLHEGLLDRARAQSDEVVVAVQLFQLASFAFEEGRVQDAFRMLKESLRINRDHDRPGGIAENLCHFAEFLAADRRAEMAVRLLSKAEALSEEIGGVPSWVAELNEKTLITLHAQLDEAAFGEAWEQGRALTLDEAVTLALDS
jgi:predicted ATPase